MFQLVLEMRAAAAQIGEPAARLRAASEARNIPRTFAERFARGEDQSSKGNLAARGRAIMESLNRLATPAERAEAALALRLIAELLAESNLARPA
jgi:hypothetical protein